MPLQEDGWYRGPHAVHVERHRKLSRRHGTVLRRALELVSWLVDLPEIDEVRLGKLGMPAVKAPSDRLQVRFKYSYCLWLLVSDGAKMQIISVVCQDEAALEMRIRAKAEELQLDCLDD